MFDKARSESSRRLAKTMAHDYATRMISNLFEPRTLSKTEKKKRHPFRVSYIHRSTACRCISSAIYCGISSMRSIVYHQVADTCTLARDDIQPKGLIIYECISRQRRVMHSMIYQVCDLDKKILQQLSFLQYFFGADYGLAK